MADTYKKSKGNAGLEGVQFQLNLLTVSLLNALRCRTNWKISTENSEAGKYDDIVIELPGNNAVLIQSKHKHNKKVTKDQLFSHNSKNDDFSLPKYFFSYEAIKNKFKTKTVIICTNAEIVKKGLESFITSQTIDSDSMLYHGGDSCSLFAFNENILADLRASAETYYDKNLRSKNIDRAVITDENLIDFLKNLQFVSGYPDGNRLDKIIGELLLLLKASRLYRKTSPQEIYKKVEEWFKQTRGEYLTEVRAKAMFCEIKSDRYCESLDDYEVSFELNNLSFASSKRMYHLTSEKGYLLQILKIYSALRNDKSKKLFINPDDSTEAQRLMIEAFELRRYTFIIMVWTKVAEQICNKLRRILEKDQYKQVIFISEGNNSLTRHINLEEAVQLDGCVAFEDLSKESQANLLKNKNLIFQGELISPERLLDTDTLTDCVKHLDSQILEKLVKGEGVRVGECLLALDEDKARYYISRTFVREIIQIEDEKGGKEKKEEIFSEEGIYEIKEKTILIGDSAGMGKSTVLTKLAEIIKYNHPHLWVIRINLNDYTRILKDSLKKNIKTISVVELLNSLETTKLTSELERSVFSANGKVVLMMDGVDEVSPDYTDLILNLLVDCQQADNFAKMFVTTRPHLIQKVEKILKVTAFKMIPFTRQDEAEFLTKYWSHNLKLADTNNNKCKKYALCLLDKVFTWVKSNQNTESPFAAIPLQVRMLADIFQENIRGDSTDWEGCKEYISGGRTVPRLPRKFNIVELYDIFMEKKRDVFLDKGNSSGNAAANQALTDKFDECLDYHRSLALKVILAEEQSHLFLSCQPSGGDVESYILKMGIVQKLSGEYQFLHRTFAEYFFAEVILKELQFPNQNIEFQKMLIDEILTKDEYYVVRVFLNRHLQEVVDSLPDQIFKNYESLSCKNADNYSKTHIVFVLSMEGCVSILRLILKSIHFSVRKSKRTKLKKLLNLTNKNINSLNNLRITMQEYGVNFTDWRGYTPLHYAIEGGHLDMAKFLVEQGADVNSRSTFDHMVLHLAARSGDLRGVKYFMEQGIDVNVKDRNGYTALHSVVEIGNLSTVKYLLEHGSDIDAKDNDGRTPLHAAVRSHNLDIIKYLVECGADINSADSLSCTILHSAAESNNLDAVKYLVELGVDVNSKKRYGTTVLHSTVSSGDLDTVKYLVENGANVDHKALHLAAEIGKLDIVKYLVECGLDINARYNNDCTVLHAATKYPHLDIIKFLVRNNADINSRDGHGRTVLHLAATHGNLDTIEYLITCGVDVNVRDCDGCTALHLAPRIGKLDIVKYLVERGVDVNVRDNNGRTILFSTIILLDLDTVKYLVRNGADITVRDNNGRTVLYPALMFGNLDAVEYFVECGADVNNRDSDGCTVLHTAVLSKSLDHIKSFMSCGVDINSGDGNGRTALHLAALHNLTIVKYLIENGADIRRTADEGETVLHSAVKSGDLDITEYIVDLGLDVNTKNDNGYTILHSAARCGKLHIIKYLLQIGADVNSKDKTDYTVLHAAARSGDLETVKYIVKQGVDFRARDSNGNTILHSAARSANFDTVRYLMELGLDIKDRNSDGYTPQDVAPFWCKKSIAEYIQKVGGNGSGRDRQWKKLYVNLFKR